MKQEQDQKEVSDAEIEYRGNVNNNKRPLLVPDPRGTNEPEIQKLYREVKKKKLEEWGGLLHDFDNLYTYKSPELKELKKQRDEVYTKKWIALVELETWKEVKKHFDDELDKMWETMEETRNKEC